MKPYAAGSKMDKMVKAYVALCAIGDMAVWGGGLSGDLQKAYLIIDSFFLKAAYDCSMTEVEAIKTCDIYLSIAKD